MGVTVLPSFNLALDSSLFLFFGGGFGFSLTIVEFSFSLMKGFPAFSTEFGDESVESVSGLGSGPKICEKKHIILNEYE